MPEATQSAPPAFPYIFAAASHRNIHATILNSRECHWICSMKSYGHVRGNALDRHYIYHPAGPEVVVGYVPISHRRQQQESAMSTYTLPYPDSITGVSRRNHGLSERFQKPFNCRTILRQHPIPSTQCSTVHTGNHSIEPITMGRRYYPLSKIGLFKGLNHGVLALVASD